jgi:hypothetical protein
MATPFLDGGEFHDASATRTSAMFQFVSKGAINGNMSAAETSRNREVYQALFDVFGRTFF